MTKLSNGINILKSEQSPAGYLGVSVPKGSINGQRPYYAVARRSAEQLDRRLRDVQPSNAKIAIGYFDDPLEAAYAVAVLEQDPAQFLDSGQNIGDWGRSLKAPSDLSSLPTRPFAEVQAIVMGKDRKPRGEGGDHDNLWGGTERMDTRNWKEFITDVGINGKKLLTYLVQNNLAEREKAAAVISGLQRLGDMTAIKGELKKIGVDLDDDATVEKIKDTEADPRLAESQEQLDRIKQLTESILKR